eukprot:2842055-Pleurochrysis_carterae.AAC.1
MPAPTAAPTIERSLSDDDNMPSEEASAAGDIVHEVDPDEDGTETTHAGGDSSAEPHVRTKEF